MKRLLMKSFLKRGAASIGQIGCMALILVFSICFGWFIVKKILGLAAMAGVIFLGIVVVSTIWAIVSKDGD